MNKINYNQYFERILKENTEGLKLEYKPKIDQAADLSHVVNKINDDILAKKEALYLGARGGLIYTDIYKKDLLLGFKDCLKSYKDNPVEQFIISKFPEIRSKHQSMIKEGHVGGYELDPEFINITDYKVILGFTANYYAYEEVSKWLKNLLGEVGGTMKQNNESELTNYFGYFEDVINHLETKDILGTTDQNKNQRKDNNQNFDKNKIEFTTTIINKLYKSLQKYFAPEEHEQLKNLFEGKKLDKKLLFKNNANKLIDVFVRIQANDLCTGSQVKVTKWICNNFVYQDDENQIHDFSYGYIKHHFSNNKKITKQERINLDLIK